MPGIDISNDILKYLPAKILVGDHIPVSDMSIATGKDFHLRLKN
jgi:hypothetical protein